jgi:hypothetical protein
MLGLTSGVREERFYLEIAVFSFDKVARDYIAYIGFSKACEVVHYATIGRRRKTDGCSWS